MLSDRQKEFLRTICEALPIDEVNWAVTGRASLILQGIELDTVDIDILTCSKGAYEVERRLRPFSVKRVEYAEETDSCSHFGMLSIDGVYAEIIGAPQTRFEDGEWQPPVDVLMNRHFVEFDGMYLPVTTLEYEAGTLRLKGDIVAAGLAESALGQRAGV